MLPSVMSRSQIQTCDIQDTKSWFFHVIPLFDRSLVPFDFFKLLIVAPDWKGKHEISGSGAGGSKSWLHSVQLQRNWEHPYES